MAIEQNASVADGTAAEVSALTVPAVTPAPAVSLGETREQVMRELEDFQKSDQAAQLRQLYQGGN